MKLLLEKYHKLRAWIEWRDIRLADVLIGGGASVVLIAVAVLIIGSLL
jgi:hypothetical protein|tara:strand:+ start:37 stop:180 length:144 start_codon:yes stop_codon:yes gene_type:complete